MIPELLSPAGSPEALRAAFRYGADAVYIGAEAFGLRAGAQNFNPDEMAEGIAHAHALGKRVYVTANIFAHNSDIRRADEFFTRMKALAPDALIISDPGLFRMARRICPEIDIHISTQANNTNAETCRFWHDLGAKRIVLARELTLAEIAEIRAEIPAALELECFVHGAMCMAQSGRCLLSANLARRDANRGDCAQPCRWRYALTEEKRPGEYLPVAEDGSYTFIMASKDLCMLAHLKELADAGIDSFKIEGRMKSPLYVATVTRAYRQIMNLTLCDAEGADSTDSDTCRNATCGAGHDAVCGPHARESRENALARYLEELAACAARPLSTGFYFDREARDALDETGGNHHAAKPYVFVGVAGEPCGKTRSNAAADICGRTTFRMTQRNKFCKGDVIEIMKPDGRNIRTTVRRIFREDGSETEAAPHPGEILYPETDTLPEPDDVLRM